MRSSNAIAAGVLLLAGTGAFAQGNASRTQLVLQYSSYFGGSTSDWVTAVVVGADGYVYLAGTTHSRDFPTTPGAYQTRLGGDSGGGYTGPGDAFVSKIDPKTMALVYSTFLGGSLDETLIGLAVDATGSAYIMGKTTSPDFPRTPGAYGKAGGTNFVAKLHPSGSALEYSTTFGSETTDTATCFAIDAHGNAYISGSTASETFPVTPGVLQPKLNPNGAPFSETAVDAFVMKLNSSGTALVFSTYLGGPGWDSTKGIAVGPGGDVWLVGEGIRFPVTPDAMLASVAYNEPHTFIARLNSDATALLYSSYVPGVLYATMALDSSGNPYIGGEAYFSNVVLTPPFEAMYDGMGGAYYAKLTPGGQGFVYSAVLPNGWGVIGSITVDLKGQLYMAGGAGTPQPIFDGGLPSCNRDTLIDPDWGVLQGGAFVAVVDPAGQVLSSSYLGGCLQNGIHSIATDSGQNIYVAGATASYDFPVTAGAVRSNNGTPNVLGSSTGFISRVAFTNTKYPRIRRIYDAGSAYWGMLVPGQLIVIDGTDLGPEQAVGGQFVNRVLQNSVGGTTVLFDGVPAPLFSVSANRIFAVLPFSTVGGWFGWGNSKRSFVRVVRAGLASASWGEYITPRLPSFLTADGSGEGQAFAINADGTLNSPGNPARRGSTLTMYMSGAGAMDVPVIDGQIMDSAVTLTPIYAYISIGANSERTVGKIEFIGAVAGSVAGLTQLKFQIPSDDSVNTIPAPIGDSIPVVLAMDNKVTQPNVFIAIK